MPSEEKSFRIDACYGYATVRQDFTAKLYSGAQTEYGNFGSPPDDIYERINENLKNLQIAKNRLNELTKE